MYSSDDKFDISNKYIPNSSNNNTCRLRPTCKDIFVGLVILQQRELTKLSEFIFDYNYVLFALCVTR